MGLFSRIAQLIKANLNDAIERAEDPIKMLEQVILDMNAQLLSARQLVGHAIADEKQLQKQFEQEAANAAEWERRAMTAVRLGDDALAREALLRKKQYDELVAQYEDQWQKQKQAVDQLKNALRVLGDKIEQAKREKTLLEARLKRAEALDAIHQATNGIRNTNAFDEFTRLKQKVERKEAEAEATVAMAEETSGDRVARQIDELERAAAADDDLTALKQKMGVAPPPPPAPPRKRVEATPEAPPEPPVASAAAPAQAEETDQEELIRALEEIQAHDRKERERFKR